MKHFVVFDHWTNEYEVKCTQRRFPGKFDDKKLYTLHEIPEHEQQDNTEFLEQVNCFACTAAMRVFT